MPLRMRMRHTRTVGITMECLAKVRRTGCLLLCRMLTLSRVFRPASRAIRRRHPLHNRRTRRHGLVEIPPPMEVPLAPFHRPILIHPQSTHPRLADNTACYSLQMLRTLGMAVTLLLGSSMGISRRLPDKLPIQMAQVGHIRHTQQRAPLIQHSHRTHHHSNLTRSDQTTTTHSTGQLPRQPILPAAILQGRTQI